MDRNHREESCGTFDSFVACTCAKWQKVDDAGEPAPEDMMVEKMSYLSFSSTGNRTLVSRGLSVLMTSGNHSH